MPIVYSTASADDVARFVTGHYGIIEPRCGLLSRGFNDVYAVSAPGGGAFVLRLSGRRARGSADVAAETAFLAHLDACGVPVAAAVPTLGGALFTAMALPEGARPAVLFHLAKGRRPELDDPGDARLQGIALARVHGAADRYTEREGGHQKLDLDHLLHRPLAAVLALGLDAPAARPILLAIAGRLAAAVERMAPALTRTRLHGDCHGLNARIAARGAAGEQAVLFDFDDGGFGFLCYDLAVHLWAQVSFGRRRHAIWRAFDAGYRSVRPVDPADEAAVPVFVAIRHIWMMGAFASRVAEWGSEALSPAWLDREARFLLAWEDARLSPVLL